MDVDSTKVMQLLKRGQSPGSLQNLQSLDKPKESVQRSWTSGEMRERPSVGGDLSQSDTLLQCDKFFGSVISSSSSSGVQGQSSFNGDNTNQETTSSSTPASHHQQQQPSGSSMPCSNSQIIAASEMYSGRKEINDSSALCNTMNDAKSHSAAENYGHSRDFSNGHMESNGDRNYDATVSVNHYCGPQSDKCFQTTSSTRQIKTEDLNSVINADNGADNRNRRDIDQSSNSTIMSGWDAIKPNCWNIPRVLRQNKTIPVVFKNQSISSDASQSSYNSSQRYCSSMNDNSSASYADLDSLGATGGRSPSPVREIEQKIPPLRLGLLGGGESALASHNSNTGWGSSGSGSGASSWGTNSTSTASNQWGSHNRSHHPGSNPGNVSTVGSDHTEGTSSKPQNTWAQAAGKGLNLSNNNNTSGSQNQGTQGTNIGASGNINKFTTSEDDEIRQAASSQEGWGQGVNQDTAWDVPSSPEPRTKDNNPSVWRASVSNGTEIWESNLRNGGRSIAPPQPPQQPWGRNPTTNIGGTWGEEEDTSNMWTGVPGNGGSHNQWGSPTGNAAAAAAVAANANNYWGGQSQNGPQPQQVDKSKQWGPVAPQGNGPPPNSGPPPHQGPAQPWVDQPRAPGPSLNMPGDNGTAAWSGNKPSVPSSWQGGPPPTARPLSKDNSIVGHNNAGWQEPSPPPQRRSAPQSSDDGTAVWGNPGRQGKVCHWKEMPSTKGGSQPNMMPLQPGPGMIRLPSAQSKLQEQDNPAWSKNVGGGRSAGWAEAQQENMWCEDGKGPGTPNTPNSVSSWGGEPNPMSQHPQWGAKPKTPSVSSWSDGQIDTSNWGNPLTKQGAKPLTKELIWASKQFRLLSERGFQKDDVENSLRNNNMDMDDALMELQREYGKDHGSMMNSGGLDSDNFVNNLVPGMRSTAKLRPSSISDDFVDQMSHPGMDVGPANMHGPGQVFGQNFKPQGTSTSGSQIHQQHATLLNGVGNSYHLHSNNHSQQHLNNFNSDINPVLQQHRLQHSKQNYMGVLSQPGGGGTGAGQPVRGTGNLTNNTAQQNGPSAAQLRHLVHQIQMAVHAGHLNPQILNQPLAPATLLLLNQLLQQLKVLQQLTTQQQYSQAQQHIGGKSNNPTPLQISVQITKTKQQIGNLQNQIAAQQALYVKQQQVGAPGFQQQQQLQPNVASHPHQPNSMPSAGGSNVQSSDPFITSRSGQSGGLDGNIIPPNNSLQSDFHNMSLKDSHTPQSRLNQWKLPSMDKDESGCGMNMVSTINNDFSRAPGSIAKPSSMTPTNTAAAPLSHSQSTPNLNPLLGQGDGTWSSLPRGDSGWPDSSPTTSIPSSSSLNVNAPSSSTLGDCKESQWPVSSVSSVDANTITSANTAFASLSELVNEFEPGKPWKGVMKNVEDDPHMTPGSVARSPLSLNAIKDSDALFNMSTVSKASPVGPNSNSQSTGLAPSLSLSSSTWSFTSSAAPASSLSNSMYSSSAVRGKNPMQNQKNWSEPGMHNHFTSEVWGSSTKTRPPPGLTSQNKPWGQIDMNRSVSWQSGGGGGVDSHSAFSNVSGNGSSGSFFDGRNTTWLVLRNLTPQIDGSTLKTLCLQHGPLQLFHLNLTHGIALVCYSTREEAAKAQNALNNCVLGNTTILADFPSESEVQSFVQHASGGNWNGTTNTPTSATPGYRAIGGAKYSTNNKVNVATSVSTTSVGHLWPMSSGSSGGIWSTPSFGNQGDHHGRNTPLSYLPGDLLGSESA
ncbi:Uncharacterised protein g6992 [Pycnogonum litorale]